jgi:polygalacturonase
MVVMNPVRTGHEAQPKKPRLAFALLDVAKRMLRRGVRREPPGYRFDFRRMSPISIRAAATLIFAVGLLNCSSNGGTNGDVRENGGASDDAGGNGSASVEAGATGSDDAGPGGASDDVGVTGSADAEAGATSADAGGNPGGPYFKAYSKAPYETASSVYTLKVNGTSVDVVRYYNLYSYAHLAFEGTATFTVTLKSGATITSFGISPHSYGLNAAATKSGSSLTFSRVQANSSYLVVKVSTASGALENLFIAADPRETDAPTIGGNVKDITAAPYNADKTGASLMTSTIQNAINGVSGSGGGTVYFPTGVYQFSTISMKSNVTLYLEEGAVLRGSSNRADYVWDTSSTVNGNPSQGQQNILIFGKVTNVAIKGRGMIDANSTSLASPSKTGGTLDGFGGYRKGIIASGQSGSDRPDGITLEGVTVKDSTTWSFNIEDAQNVTFQNVKLLNDYNWIHSDGYDICSTTNALVDNCLGVTGDDVFDGKVSSTNALENVTYSNDVAYSDKGAGTKMGVQARGPANNVSFTNIDVVSGYRGISLAHDDGTGAWTDIHCTDIRTETIVGSSTGGEFRVAPLLIWTAAYGSGVGPMTGVSLLRCNFENTAGKISYIQGDSASSEVSDVSLQDVTMDGVAITSANYATKIDVGANVSNLTF